MKYTWLVEKYLEGDLHGKERKEFELMILTDPSVAEEVERIRKLHAFSFEQHRKLKNSVELIEEFNDPVHVLREDEIMQDLDSMKIRKITDPAGYRDMLQKIRKTMGRDSSEKRDAKIRILLKHNFWLTAASFALILTVSSLLLVRSLRNSDPLAAYAEFYHPYAPELTIRSTEEATADDYLSGLNEYRNANYSNALALFNASLAHDPGNLPVYLFKGISLMELGDFSQALLSFKELHSDPILDEYGRWYSGMCFLQLGRTDEARKIFRDLSRQRGYFAPQARAVMRLF
jgi:tetratricopeptide (TPR) repeat protein